MQALLDVLQNYLATKSNLNGRAEIVGTLDQNSILHTLPEFFRRILNTHNRLEEFLVEGSIGAGNMAEVPWVGVFNRKITTSAQNGFYIVLLFSKDMSSCYLTLNQGVTAFEREYTSKIALQKMKASGEQALRFITPDPSAILGLINLKASGHLGKGYERGAVESYYYSAASLPSPAILEANFLTLLNHYDTLFSIAGITLQSLTPVTEQQYQQAVLEKAIPVTKKKSSYKEPAGALPVPQLSSNKSSNGYQRNPTVAANALDKAGFKCEISPSHETFVSNAKSLPYVEAHHLIPISMQGKFTASLDVLANVIALCPMCHKLLHHGRMADKKIQLIQLLNVRHQGLKEKGIELDEATLLSYYSGELLEEDA
jgi:5-methylcytosine-specific restriction enzyme A